MSYKWWKQQKCNKLITTSDLFEINQALQIPLNESKCHIPYPIINFKLRIKQRRRVWHSLKSSEPRRILTFSGLPGVSAEFSLGCFLMKGFFWSEMSGPPISSGLVMLEPFAPSCFGVLAASLLKYGRDPSAVWGTSDHSFNFFVHFLAIFKKTFRHAVRNFPRSCPKKVGPSFNYAI